MFPVYHFTQEFLGAMIFDRGFRLESGAGDDRGIFFSLKGTRIFLAALFYISSLTPLSTIPRRGQFLNNTLIRYSRPGIVQVGDSRVRAQLDLRLLRLKARRRARGTAPGRYMHRLRCGARDAEPGKRESLDAGSSVGSFSHVGAPGQAWRLFPATRPYPCGILPQP